MADVQRVVPPRCWTMRVRSSEGRSRRSIEGQPPKDSIRKRMYTDKISELPANSSKSPAERSDSLAKSSELPTSISG